MSHEIRTPMNGIIGFTTLVLDGDLTPEQRRHVTHVRDAGRSLLAIINDILDFSKVEAGKVELENIPLNVSAVVDGALSIVRMEALPKGIALDVGISADVAPWVSGDPTRLRQILLNLLTNALKFTERGTIRVDVRPDPDHADGIRFAVADTGIGIAADQRHLLFRDFSQVDRSTTRRYGGTGLGLAISKRLVEAMGGSIGCDSEPGAGSTFFFTVHLPQIAEPLAVATDAPPDPLARRRILVVDDNRVNQMVVENLLTRDGHEVTVADDGDEALEAVRRRRFDIVLMDMQMPIMDGLEATRAIRALPPPACEVPIVALTANALAEEVERCHAAGMNGHLAKPVDRDLLRRAIAHWTRAAREPARPDPTRQPNERESSMHAQPHFTDSPTLGIATLVDIFDGDIASVGELLAAALASIEVDLGRIQESVASHDVETLIEAAHRMKGTSGSIRSHRVIAASTAVEHAAKTAPANVGADQLAELAGAVAELRRDFDAQRGSLIAAV